MEEKQIKELIKEKYPNPEPFWDNNKDWILELVSKVEINLLFDLIGTDTDIDIFTKIDIRLNNEKKLIQAMVNGKEI